VRLALVTLIGFASASYAQVCHSPIVHHAYPVTPVVVKKVVTPVFFAVPIPVYGAVYTPPVPTPASGGDELKQVAEALKAIDARLKQLERPAPQAAPPPSNPFQPQNAGGNPLGVVQAKCAQCHDGKVSAEKGGGFTMIENGVLARLTPGQALKALSTAYKGTMPPKSSGLTLSDEETAVLVGHYGGK
jgi:cytochrome c5